MRAYTDETYYINDYLKGRKPVQQGTAQHYYEMASSYRSVLSGGVICIPMRM